MHTRKHKRTFALAIMKEWMHMWQMCRETLFSWTPLLSFCCGFASRVYSSSRWHHCPGWGEKKAERCIKAFTACLQDSIRQCCWMPKAKAEMCAHRAVSLLFTVAIFCIAGYHDMWPLCCLFACRSWTWLCLHATVHQQSGEGKFEKEKQKQEEQQ